MARSSGLGRGLSALIPSDISEEDDGSLLRNIDIAHVVPNRFQPRSHFNEEALAALADSIAAVGVIQPIIVRETSQGYEILAGERRWRAARKNGLAHIPALVRSVDDRGALEAAVVENIQREDLNALEEAAAYRQLTDDFGLTHKEVANNVGRSRSAVANTIRLLNLPAGVQRLIMDGRLTAGHGRALLSLKGDGNRQKLAEEVVKNGLTVRETEKLAASGIDSVGEAETSGEEEGKAEEPPDTQAEVLEYTRELGKLLTSRLDAKVSVKIARGARSQGPGKIIIDFSDLSDLERIYYSVITPPGTGEAVQA